ncbi:MAG: hypothetical protein ACN4G0_07620 [Polyangiales bacterium]
MRISVLLTLLACSVCVLVAAGPTGMAQKADESSVASYVAPKGKAVVVLVRSRALTGSVKFRVIDKKRRCTAMIKGRSHVGMVVKPGKHKFYILAAKRVVKAERVDAHVTAGRTYIIETRPRAKMKERIDVETVRRGSDRFSESVHWITGTKSISSNLAECTQWVAQKSSKVTAAIASAEQEWELSGDFYRKARTLSPKDGRTKKELGDL